MPRSRVRTYWLGGLIAFLVCAMVAEKARAQGAAPSPAVSPSPGAGPSGAGPSGSSAAGGAGERGRALVVLDGSKSMNEDAGNGGSRLDAAKAATLELLDAIPDDTELGLRIYGSRVAGVARAEACRDTRLAFPVGPTDRGDIRGAVEGLTGVGRTPIGRSLLAGPQDLGPDGRRVVVLVSDGGDNCAPPDPCEAAKEVSRQGLDLTVSVVGLQVSSERVRRQLECIAKAGGGTYVGVDDVDQLAGQLQAMFLRAFRTYDPVGEPVRGALSPSTAPQLVSGRFLDSLSGGEQKFYAVEVPAGRRLVVLPTFVTSVEHSGGGSGWVELLDSEGEQLELETESLNLGGGFNRVSTPALVTGPAGADGFAPGRYTVAVKVNNSNLDLPVPVELAVDVGVEGSPIDFRRDPVVADDSRRDSGGNSSGSSGGLKIVAGAGLASLLVGLLVGFVLIPRRHA